MVTNLTTGWKLDKDQVKPDFKVSMRSSDEIITSVLKVCPQSVGVCPTYGQIHCPYYLDKSMSK